MKENDIKTPKWLVWIVFIFYIIMGFFGVTFGLVDFVTEGFLGIIGRILGVYIFVYIPMEIVWKRFLKN